MEHAAVTGNFGGSAPTTPAMTLQQAVFARIVNPGDIYIVRELKNDANPSDVDIARFSGAFDEYVITNNGDGSTTVDHQGGPDGVDTLWNIETLRFCNGVDANGVCNVFDDRSITGGGAGTPALSVTPTGTTAAAPLLFGTVAVGAAPATRDITVTNTGSGFLNVTGATLTGANVTSFSILDNGCAGNPVGGGGSCVIQVGFTPTLAPLLNAQRNASLNIVTNVSPGGTATVFLRGQRAIVANLTTATIDSPTDFGTRRIGEPRTQIVRVTNDGAVNNLTVTGVSTTGPFTATNVDCTNVLPGRTCRLSVTFNPTAPIGDKAGTVRIQGNVTTAVTPGVLTGASKAAAVVVGALRIVQPATRAAVKPVNVSLRVSTAASIRLQVRKTNGKLVWSKRINAKKAGTAKLKWNLRDSKGHRVKKGRYVFTITVTDTSGAKVIVKRTVRVR